MILQTLSHSAQNGWSTVPQISLDSPQTLVLVFGGSKMIDAPAPVLQLMSAFPQASFLGCSTSGEIFGTRISDDSIAAAVLRFERTAIKMVSAPVSAVTSFQAGESLGRQLADSGPADSKGAGTGLRAVLVLSEGLHVNGSELVRGINSALPPSVVVTGGLAGDGDRFASTWVIHERALKKALVTAVGFYGDALRVGHGSKGGWDAFGLERKVTRSEANVLFELDDRPALALYKEYLGDRADGLPATGLLFPLALRAPGDEGKRLVRTILGVDEAKQSLIFAGDIPVGHFAQLMSANFDRLIEGAGDAALATARGSNDTHDTLALAISCVGRRLVLGDHCEEETEAAVAALPAHAKQIGFYSYGEISPHTTGHCDLHNQTMTLTTFSEA